MIYNRSIEGSSSLPQYKAEVTTMLKDMDFGVYGKGIDCLLYTSHESLLNIFRCIINLFLSAPFFRQGKFK